MNLYCTLQENVIPCLEFTMEFQSNKLIYQKAYTKRQQIIYVLIQHLHDREGFGYRKISQWLNQSGIKTLRGKSWFSSSVISVLKRKHERDLMNEQIRNQHFSSKVSKFEINLLLKLIKSIVFDLELTNLDIDTSNLTINEVVAKVMALVKT